MKEQFSRRALLGLRHVVRPPWALEEGAFVETCTRCGHCVENCPEGIVNIGRGGYPQVEFERGCTFCARCLQACPSGALVNHNGEARGWTHVAGVDEQCLAARGVDCRVCGEVCEAEAIRFQLRLGAPPAPDLDPERCTGCGACVPACPAAAIGLRTEPATSPG